MNDHILNGSHCDFEKIGISCVCEMAVYFSSWTSVQSDKLVHEILARLLPACCVTLEIGEAEFGDGTVSNLGLEYVHLIQEKDQCRILEPMRIGNRLPQHQSFLHLILQMVSFYPPFSTSILTPSLSSAKH